jgi:hypothetical protein
VIFPIWSRLVNAPDTWSGMTLLPSFRADRLDQESPAEAPGDLAGAQAVGCERRAGQDHLDLIRLAHR